MECTSRSTDRYQIRQLPLIFKSVLCAKGKCHAVFTIIVRNIYTPFVGQERVTNPQERLRGRLGCLLTKRTVCCSRSVDAMYGVFVIVAL